VRLVRKSRGEMLVCVYVSFCLRTSTYACVDSSPSIAFSRYSPLASGAGILLCVSPLLSYDSPSFDSKQRTRQTNKNRTAARIFTTTPSQCWQLRVCVEQSTQRRRRGAMGQCRHPLSPSRVMHAHAPGPRFRPWRGGVAWGARGPGTLARVRGSSRPRRRRRLVGCVVCFGASMWRD
jgi:hypothetical protein